VNEESRPARRLPNDSSSAANLAPAPAVTIQIALESAPRVRFEVFSEEGGGRLLDWLEAHPDYLDLTRRALELGEEARAA
jgi:hypothetical protein